MEEKKKKKKKRRRSLIRDEEYVPKVMRTEANDFQESMAIIRTTGCISGRKL